MAQIKVVTVNIGLQDGSFAIGYEAYAGACGCGIYSALAVGAYAGAGACAAVALGYYAMAGGGTDGSVVVGATANAGYCAANAVVIGYSTRVDLGACGAVAVGACAFAIRPYSIVLGYGATDSDRCTAAIAFAFGPCGSHRVSVASDVWINFCNRLNNGCI